ncbi:MAG: tetratricopeptide repeat protein [Rhodobacteraceae bacterium]|nr:tetratricopeptide repeat protein [Paracoccaceae bacterium]
MRLNVERKIREAKSLERKGDVIQALRLYEDIAHQFPANPRAKKAIFRLEIGINEPSQSDIRDVSQAYTQGKLDLTLARTEQLLDQFPQSEKLWTLRGAAAVALGHFSIAESAFSQSVKLKPKLASAYANLGAALERQDKHVETIRHFSEAIELSPNQAGYYRSRGNAHRRVGDLKAAILDLTVCTKLNPRSAENFNNLGLALQETGQSEYATQAYETAIRLDPNNPNLLVSAAESNLQNHDTGAAISLLNSALLLAPEFVTALVSLGTAYLETGDIEGALVHLDRAVALDPSSVAARNNLGSAQLSARMYDAAHESCKSAIALKPDHASAYQNLANVQQQLGQLDLAVESYATAVGLNGNLHAAQAQKLHFQAKMCDWHALEEFEVVAGDLGINGEAVPPWSILGYEDNPAHQRLRSGRFATQWQCKRPDWNRTADRPRIRVGYFSSDLSEHATLFLLNGVLEHHNKSDFEIFVYGLNEPKQSPEFDRLVRNTEHFVDVHRASDDDIVALARRDGLDIAIDLKGYTQGARSGLFFAGLAPIQINYLGYPGTMATPCMDYLIADETVVPPEQRKHYSEHLIYLPGSYQPNDDQRTIAQAPLSRASCGLPEDAVVMCCFNSSYKITPQEFDIWMRVLLSVPDTVLWLLDCNAWANENLRQAARKRGVDDKRLIFGEKLVQETHLARHRLADIFVDTFNVNAHTTASDALWAGLPVVTKVGSQFAARVAASLLNAVGMPDLVTKNTQQYEDLITRLAGDKPALAAVKTRLSANLTTTPLFDTAAYTAHLEEGYRQVWQRRQKGGAPQDIHVGNKGTNV